MPAVFQGFFWFPRTLFGIEGHLLAFYDHPRLMHRMNEDLLRYNMKLISAVQDVFEPAFVCFNEDLSYNHGPMLSREMFDEFIAPYYREIVPLIRKQGLVAMVDTDGFMEDTIPWFESVGVNGSGPIERMAGNDVCRMRKNHPSWRMYGGFDKTVMHKGEEAMRREFERLLPAMRSGGYIPCVDHQTPPEVSLDDYRLYVRLLQEYARRAVQT
jgi:uroporphyrinogen-III decarboxylase